MVVAHRGQNKTDNRCDKHWFIDVQRSLVLNFDCYCLKSVFDASFGRREFFGSYSNEYFKYKYQYIEPEHMVWCTYEE